MTVLGAGEYSGDIECQWRFDNAIVSNTVYSSRLSSPSWHSHKNLHVCLVFQNGKSETKHSAAYADRTGSIFLYRAEERHRWISTDPLSKSLNLEVSPEYLAANDLSEADLTEAVRKRADAKVLMLKVQLEMQQSDGISLLAVQSLLLALFSSEARGSVLSRPKWATDLKDLLNDEWRRDLPLSDLSSILGIHPVTISKYFRKYFACTLGEYRRRLRVEKSIGLIRDSRKSLTEIALECGFSDQSHFTRTFKSTTGFLPRDFRIL